MDSNFDNNTIADSIDEATLPPLTPNAPMSPSIGTVSPMSAGDLRLPAAVMVGTCSGGDEGGDVPNLHRLRADEPSGQLHLKTHPAEALGFNKVRSGLGQDSSGRPTNESDVCADLSSLNIEEAGSSTFDCFHRRSLPVSAEAPAPAAAPKTPRPLDVTAPHSRDQPESSHQSSIHQTPTTFLPWCGEKPEFERARIPTPRYGCLDMKLAMEEDHEEAEWQPTGESERWCFRPGPSISNDHIVAPALISTPLVGFLVAALI